MNSLLPSPTLIDLSLRHDLHLIIVLQVTASVLESFVEIGIWGGKKKNRPDKCPDGKTGSSLCVCVCVLVVFARPAEGTLCAMETSAGDWVTHEAYYYEKTEFANTTVCRITGFFWARFASS